MRIKQLHYISGLIITVFVGLHLFNHLSSIFGIETYMEVMDTLRLVYRNIVVESILLLAVVVQIISGIKLFFTTKKSGPFFRKLQIWSGLYLAFFFLIHVSAILVGRFVLNVDTNFYYGAAGLNIFPLNLFFIPYYTLAILSFFGHIAGIHFMKMKHDVFGMSPKKQSQLILIVGVFVLIAILFGMTNGAQGFEIPAEYGI
jgi:succinate dehydrogenase/fumarate reductase cytochrome b subunit